MEAIIIVLILVSLLASLLLFVDYESSYKKTLLFSVLLMCWLSLSINIPHKPENITEEKLKIELLNDIQTVTYKISESDNFNTVNLNTKFGKIVNEDKQDVILRTYKGDWYKGIYWSGRQEVLLRDKE
jgi:hypothetical protein